jgi:hypothetical protein
MRLVVGNPGMVHGATGFQDHWDRSDGQLVLIETLPLVAYCLPLCGRGRQASVVEDKFTPHELGGQIPWLLEKRLLGRGQFRSPSSEKTVKPLTLRGRAGCRWEAQERCAFASFPREAEQEWFAKTQNRFVLHSQGRRR